MVGKSQAYSCIEKFCMSFIQIQRYRHQQSPKENIQQNCFFERKSHGYMIIITFQVQISAHLALELSSKELKMLFNQCSQAPKHNGDRLD